MPEKFITAKEVIESNLIPGLNEDKLRHYVRKGFIRAYGFGKGKTYLLSEVYEFWKNSNRRFDGPAPVQKRSPEVGGRLQKAWRQAS